MRIFFCSVLFMLCFSAISCKKYLDAKNTNQVAIPSTVLDCQMLLDNTQAMNRWSSLDGECMTDNYWLYQWQYDAWGGADFKLHLYYWADDIFVSDETSNVWVTTYSVVEIANTVLETLSRADNVDRSSADYRNAEGSALFYRAYCFEKLLFLFSKGYNEATKDKDLGIPLRTTSDFTVPSTRSSVGASYEKVIADLLAAKELLPSRPLFPQRPSKQAVFGALSEVYLAMHDYQHSRDYADSALLISGELLDYNEYDTTATKPFANIKNKEVVFYLVGNARIIGSAGYYNIDTTLLRSYDDKDLRRKLFYRPDTDTTYSFKGSYSSVSFYFFTGIANR